MFIEGWHQLICGETHHSRHTSPRLILGLFILGFCSALLQHQHQVRRW